MFTAKYDLIIFDCDGVLVDSEPVSNRIFWEMLTAAGVVVTQEECFRTFTGLSDSTSARLVKELYNLDLGKSFWADYADRTIEELGRSVTTFPGLLEIVREVSPNCCVASNGSHARMQVTLGRCGLLPYFTDRIFSAFDVARGKPAPDLFLHAAKTLRVTPEMCAVIEDSKYGVQAAMSAGMDVYGYSPHDMNSPLGEYGATVFHHMDELERLLS